MNPSTLLNDIRSYIARHPSFELALYGFVFIAFLYVVISQKTHLNNQERQLKAAEQDFAWMKNVSTSVLNRRLRVTQEQPLSPDSIVNRVVDLANQAGVRISRYAENEQGAMQVWIEESQFTSVYGFLTQLERQNIVIGSLNITNNDFQGGVDVYLRLSAKTP